MLSRPDTKSHEVVLFSKCTGLNDSLETTAAAYLPDGTTDVIACLNVTTTPEGKLVKVPALSTVFAHSTAVDELTAGLRMFVQNGTDLSEFDGTSLTPLVSAPTFTAGVKSKYVHTPIDLRVRVSTGISHKLKNGLTSTAALTLGTYVGPANSRSSVFEKMPDFTGAFLYNARLISYFGNFLQYSEPYNYDLWHLTDNQIGSKNAIVQAGQIPGCVVTMHSDGINAYFCGDISKVENKTFYPCSPIAGTLYSGFLSKVYESAHVFLCADGVYVLDATGKLVNLTVANTDHLDTLNTSYNTVSVENGKYLAYGNAVCVEYDFQVKALLIRSTFGITTSCFWNKQQYFGSGVNIVKQLDTQNTGTLVTTVQLPYSDFFLPFHKQIRFLYFTGKITGPAFITVRNQYGQSVTKDISNIGYVQNYKITGLRTCKGPRLSVEITTQSGEFKLEELRAAFNTCSNYN
jgi:hypothetical protein